MNDDIDDPGPLTSLEENVQLSVQQDPLPDVVSNEKKEIVEINEEPEKLETLSEKGINGQQYSWMESFLLACKIRYNKIISIEWENKRTSHSDETVSPIAKMHITGL